jgi:hypothetical protein
MVLYNFLIWTILKKWSSIRAWGICLHWIFYTDVTLNLAICLMLCRN